MNLWTYVGQIVNFIIFVVILYFLLYKPVRKILRERKEEMESDLRDAEKKREEAEKIRKEAEEKLKAFEKERDKAMSEARKSAEEERKALLQKAEEEARAKLEGYRRIMGQERNELLEKVQGELRESVIEATGAIIRDSADLESIAEEGLKRLEEQLEGLSEEDLKSARKALSDADGEAKVFHAGFVSKQQLKRLGVMLGKTFGEDEIKLDAREDPSLLAGWKIELGPLHLLANWRATIESALADRSPSPEPDEKKGEEEQDGDD